MYKYFLILPGAKRAFAEWRSYDIITKGRRIVWNGRTYKVRKVAVDGFLTVREVKHV